MLLRCYYLAALLLRPVVPAPAHALPRLAALHPAMPTYLPSAQHQEPDYLAYHQQIIAAEELMAQGAYSQALAVLEHVFASYAYVFLRDYKVATQLAVRGENQVAAFRLLRAGMAAGWTWQEINKNAFLKPLRGSQASWDSLHSDYAALRQRHKQRLSQPLRKAVKQMASQDQHLALANLLKPGQRASERFLTQTFLPHSRRQLALLQQMLQEAGYPGEKLIGTGTWMSRILSHHNSATTTHTQQDTLYPQLQPQLLNAVRRGEMAPSEYAIVEEWYVVIKSNRQQAAYGYLLPLTEQELPQADERRRAIGLRSVALRNKLVALEKLTGMQLYLDGTFWVKGKLPIVANR